MSELAQKLKSLTVLQIGVVLLVAGVLVGVLHFYPEVWPLGSFINEFYANASTELISIAITVLIIDRLYQRRQTEQAKELRIKRYREEIEDYLGWQSEEATHRIVGLIKRLNREGVTNINLVEAHLEGAHLEEAHLGKAQLMAANLKGANLKGADLEGADLTTAHLDGANLREAHLREAHLEGAHLDGAHLDGAHLDGADLRIAHLEGVDLVRAVWNKHTTWPEHFDPKEAGATKVEE